MNKADLVVRIAMLEDNDPRLERLEAVLRDQVVSPAEPLRSLKQIAADGAPGTLLLSGELTANSGKP